MKEASIKQYYFILGDLLKVIGVKRKLLKIYKGILYNKKRRQIKKHRKNKRKDTDR